MMDREEERASHGDHIGTERMTKSDRSCQIVYLRRALVPHIFVHVSIHI
jgi:hypothetical protein